MARGPLDYDDDDYWRRARIDAKYEEAREFIRGLGIALALLAVVLLVRHFA